MAGLHIINSNNFTFEATIDSVDGAEGEGNVGSLEGQQPIEIIIEDSDLVTFQDMRVESNNGERSPCCLAIIGSSNHHRGRNVLYVHDQLFLWQMAHVVSPREVTPTAAYKWCGHRWKLQETATAYQCYELGAGWG